MEQHPVMHMHVHSKGATPVLPNNVASLLCQAILKMHPEAL